MPIISAAARDYPSVNDFPPVAEMVPPGEDDDEEEEEDDVDIGHIQAMAARSSHGMDVEREPLVIPGSVLFGSDYAGTL